MVCEPRSAFTMTMAVGAGGTSMLWPPAAARIMAHEAISIPALRPLRRGTIEDALRAGYGPQNLRLLVPPPVERQVKVAPAFLWQ